MEERIESTLLAFEGRHNTLQDTLFKLTTELRGEVEGMRVAIEQVQFAQRTSDNFEDWAGEMKAVLNPEAIQLMVK